MNLADAGYNLVAAHPFITLGAYYVYSAAVSALPMPSDTDGKFYHWLFGFMHALAGSISRGAMAFKAGK